MKNHWRPSQRTHRRRVRWSTLAAVVVLTVAVATVGAVTAVRHSGLELLDQVAAEEAQSTAAAVAHALDAQIDNTVDKLRGVVADTTITQRLEVGDPGVCATLSAVSSGTNGLILDADGDMVCQYGPSASTSAEDVRRWSLGTGDQLVAGRDGTSVVFSPVPLSGTIVAATNLGTHRIVHWIDQDTLLRSHVSRLGPRNLVMAFTPTGARKPDVALDLGDDDLTEHSTDGYDVPSERGRGPLGVDAYWASARTASGSEAVAIGVDPEPYDRERERLSSNLLQIAAVIGAVALSGVILTLWWTGRSLRRLSDAVDGASDGVIDAPLPDGGPRETRRIADALTRLAAGQVAADVAADNARADERTRIVTTLDVDIAAVLDDIYTDVAAGAPIEEYRVELDLIIERLRDVVAMLHPTALDRLGLRGAIASQISTRPGWVLTPGPEVTVDTLVAGLLYSILAELWYRNPTGTLSISTVGAELRVEVTGTEQPLSNRWGAPVSAMGGRLDIDDNRILVYLPAHIEEFAQ